ncbi:MAG: trigger factor [Oribacterium sp.]|nr:trigger factor [Oribacterium sp.]
MKKNYMLALAAGLMTLSLAACGQKTADNKETTAAAAETTAAGEAETSSTDTTATASEISSDDPEVQKLEAMTVPTEPMLKDMGTVKLPDLTTIMVETTKKLTVDDAMVDSQINYLLQQFMTETDEAAKSGDTVNIDYIGTIDGEAFDGGTATGYDLSLGSGTFIDGFEDQLIGHKKGDKVTVKVTFPSDYSNTDLAGKDAEFAVTINSVKTTPELTEQWLKDNASAIGTSATTIDEFRSEQKGLLEAQINYQYDSNVHQSALEQIVDKSEFSISDEMNDYAYAYVVQQEIQQYQQYGYDLAGAMNVLGISVSDFETEMKSYAEDFAKQKLVMKTIAEEQNISATSEMLDALAEKISGLSGTKTNRIQLIEKYGGDAVKEEAVNDAVFDYIVSQIKVVETETTTAAN